MTYGELIVALLAVIIGFLLGMVMCAQLTTCDCDVLGQHHSGDTAYICSKQP